MSQNSNELEPVALAPSGVQEQEIEHLRAEKTASQLENAGLRDAARADQLAIDELKASNQSLETLVAELRRAQAQIEELNRDQKSRNAALVNLNREMESFSYAVSHDLRSPLRSIHGFAEALQRSAAAKLAAEEAAWLQKILDAAARMDRLTEDLLRLSRVTRSQLKRERVDLTRLARYEVRELRQTDPRREVVFAIADGMEVEADPVLMRVVVGNLFSNAWKYTGRCQNSFISFDAKQIDSQTVFCVRDNGAGFDMMYAAKLFAPFQRLHSAREFPGSGVGLACVARVIHKHGGRIWADAKTGEGAAFFFTLPAMADPSAASFPDVMRSGDDN